MNYGIGYMGSKSKIAQQIIDALPPADTFVDLFCGGGAMTHCAMLSGKYKHFIINDIDKLVVDCLTKAFNGGYKDEKRWINREDFFELKDTDPYVKFCWSFGNNGNTYLYGKDIELYKKACHYAVVFNDWELFDKLCPEVSDVAKESVKDITDTKQRRLAIMRIVKKTTKRLQSLESLERLERLQSLERLENYVGDYQNVIIPDNSVIYCDIPYKNTATYTESETFDYDIFYSWAEKQTQPIFISEYGMPEDRFECVKQIEKRSMLSAKGNNKIMIEKLYIPRTRKHNIKKEPEQISMFE